MNFLNRHIALASHVSLHGNELVFEQMLQDGTFIVTTALRLSRDQCVMANEVTGWRENLYALTGLRSGPADPEGRALLEHAPRSERAEDIDPLGPGTQIAIPKSGYTFWTVPVRPRMEAIAFVWPDGKTKISLDHLRPAPIGSNTVTYVTWLLTIAFRPFTIERQEENRHRITLTIA